MKRSPPRAPAREARRTHWAGDIAITKERLYSPHDGRPDKPDRRERGKHRTTLATPKVRLLSRRWLTPSHDRRSYDSRAAQDTRQQG